MTRPEVIKEGFFYFLLQLICDLPTLQSLFRITLQFIQHNTNSIGWHRPVEGKFDIVYKIQAITVRIRIIFGLLTIVQSSPLLINNDKLMKARIDQHCFQAMTVQKPTSHGLAEECETDYVRTFQIQ